MDYSQPLSTLFKAGTAKSHDNVRFNKAGVVMFGGLDKEEYVRYLMILYYLYRDLEVALDKHPTHPVLETTYNPPVLARAASLEADIAFLLEIEQDKWKSHPIHMQLLADPPAVIAKYSKRLQELADSDDPSPLLAHSYVRYFGDLNGGQAIRGFIAKAYNLDEESGSGVAFYDFLQLDGKKRANEDGMQKIMKWFRDGMNAAASNDRKFIDKMIDEAKLAFVYAGETLDALRVPNTEKPPPTTTEDDPKTKKSDGEYKVRGGKYNAWSFAAILGAACITAVVVRKFYVGHKA